MRRFLLLSSMRPSRLPPSSLRKKPSRSSIRKSLSGSPLKRRAGPPLGVLWQPTQPSLPPRARSGQTCCLKRSPSTRRSASGSLSKLRSCAGALLRRPRGNSTSDAMATASRPGRCWSIAASGVDQPLAEILYARSGAALRRRRRHAQERLRHQDAELAPLASNALHVVVQAQGLRQPIDDRQPDAAAGRIAVAAALAALERVEDRLLLVRRDAAPRVAHLKHENPASALVLPGGAEHDPAALGRVADGVD